MVQLLQRLEDKGVAMHRTLTLEYWQDDKWLVGRLCEVPGVFSQGETVEELEENIRDAYRLVLDDAADGEVHAGAQTREIGIEL